MFPFPSFSLSRHLLLSASAHSAAQPKIGCLLKRQCSLPTDKRLDWNVHFPRPGSRPKHLEANPGPCTFTRAICTLARPPDLQRSADITAALLGLLCPVELIFLISAHAHMLSRTHADVYGGTRQPYAYAPPQTCRNTTHTSWPNTTNTHSLCMTDGTCQDAKTQPRDWASLKWPSARSESSE